MPSTYALTLDYQQTDKTQAIITDTSTYSGELRGDKANFLVVSKQDKVGVPTYLTVNNPSPLTAMSWTFPTALDGWYRFNFLRIPDQTTNDSVTVVAEASTGGVITTYASIIYFVPTGKLYKSLTSGTFTLSGAFLPSATVPTTYWSAPITDLTTLVNYGAIQVLTWGDLISAYLKDILRDYLQALSNKPWYHPLYENNQIFEKANNLDSDLNGVEALNSDQRWAEMEESVRTMSDMYKAL